MKWINYEISKYSKDDIEEISVLLSSLLGNDISFNRKFFIWKHQLNPYLKENIGLVARHARKVIAFLGYVPAIFKIGQTRFNILQQCDTVVHPEYRGKGLFSIMSKIGLQIYNKEYKYIVNFTSNNRTASGLLKLGWVPLANNYYLRRFNLINLLQNNLFKAKKAMLDMGVFRNIEVSQNIKAKEISDTAFNDYYSMNKISLDKSPVFTSWRLSSPGVKLIYIYLFSGNYIIAYLILRVSQTNAYIFDYAQLKDTNGVPLLLNFVLKNNKFTSISFISSSIHEELKLFLGKNHFNRYSAIDKIKQRSSYNIPIILRPTKEVFEEEDWYIDGVDVRDKNNWQITEIYFD